MASPARGVRIGVFVVPDAIDPAATVAQLVAADAAGLDFVGVQDHPYQRRFLDTWTLLSYVAARTDRVRLLPDVLNLPLRPPAMIAKAAASLDVLSGGRVEIGLGAGAFWDGVEAMGGPRRTPKESVDALDEAIAVLRAFWDGAGGAEAQGGAGEGGGRVDATGDDARGVRVDGEHYRLAGAKPGPAPAHPIGIWLGAYGPRMLRLTGRRADGWLPSLGTRFLPPENVPGMHAAIDEAARAAGRDPAAIERAVNITGLDGDPVDQLARVVTDLRFTTLLVAVPSGDPVAFIRRLGEDVAPALRARVP
jgi:alkanesulfonate monooxygenase SsuD/methylene tetrahydromethanopterin reductase-like flavin-dependent oxidoreductase (luciferase family)